MNFEVQKADVSTYGLVVLDNMRKAFHTEDSAEIPLGDGLATREKKDVRGTAYLEAALAA